LQQIPSNFLIFTVEKCLLAISDFSWFESLGRELNRDRRLTNPKPTVLDTPFVLMEYIAENLKTSVSIGKAT
jgi:hypothetical protein